MVQVTQIQVILSPGSPSVCDPSISSNYESSGFVARTSRRGERVTGREDTLPMGTTSQKRDLVKWHKQFNLFPYKM